MTTSSSQALKQFVNNFAWKSATTEDFRKVFESVSGQKLDYFFLQWIESSGAPEFKMDYTVFRTSKGFRVMGKISQDLDTFRMPVEMRIETEGNPEEKRIEVSGTSSEFVVETFGKPKKITLDPNNKVLHYSNPIRVAVAIRRGEQFVESGRVHGSAEGIPEGSRRESHQLPCALPCGRSLHAAEQLSVGRECIPGSAAGRSWTRSGQKCGVTLIWVKSSMSPASATGRSMSTRRQFVRKTTRKMRKRKRLST